MPEGVPIPDRDLGRDEEDVDSLDIPDWMVQAKRRELDATRDGSSAYADPWSGRTPYPTREFAPELDRGAADSRLGGPLVPELGSDEMAEFYEPPTWQQAVRTGMEMSSRQYREVQLDAKHGDGWLGWYRKFIHGEYDLLISRSGRIQNNLPGEFVRRVARTVNRRTIGGAAGLYTFGLLTGGLSEAAPLALGAAAIGRFIVEARHSRAEREALRRELRATVETKESIRQDAIESRDSSRTQEQIRTSRKRVLGALYSRSGEQLRKLRIAEDQTEAIRAGAERSAQVVEWLASLGGYAVGAAAEASTGTFGTARAAGEVISLYLGFGLGEAVGRAAKWASKKWNLMRPPGNIARRRRAAYVEMERQIPQTDREAEQAVREEIRRWPRRNEYWVYNNGTETYFVQIDGVTPLADRTNYNVRFQRIRFRGGDFGAPEERDTTSTVEELPMSEFMERAQRQDRFAERRLSTLKPGYWLRFDSATRIIDQNSRDRDAVVPAVTTPAAGGTPETITYDVKRDEDLDRAGVAVIIDPESGRQYRVRLVDLAYAPGVTYGEKAKRKEAAKVSLKIGEVWEVRAKDATGRPDLTSLPTELDALRRQMGTSGRIQVREIRDNNYYLMPVGPDNKRTNSPVAVSADLDSALTSSFAYSETVGGAKGGSARRRGAPGSPEDEDEEF